MEDRVIIDGQVFVNIGGKLYKLIPNDCPFSLTEEQKKEENKKRMIHKSKVEYYMITHHVGRAAAIEAIDKMDIFKGNK